MNEDSYGAYRTFVRVNPIESGMTLIDLKATASPNLRGFVYPMARKKSDLESFASQLKLMEYELGLEEGHFTIVALIETPSGLANVEEIAKTERVEALLFGCEDYLAEMGAEHTPNHESILFARTKIVNACRGNEIVPIDTPYVQMRNLSGMESFANFGNSLGMDGMLVLSPDQIEVANRAYSPSIKKEARARKIIDAAEEAERMERGVIVLEDGEFISPPTIKWANKLINRVERKTTWKSFGK